jgi:hypothetical protein
MYTTGTFFAQETSDSKSVLLVVAEENRKFLVLR